ncbi:GHKL domain-containing protein, partial [bacterium]|nr:GHKL domain-containing protein [bacterium]
LIQNIRVFAHDDTRQPDVPVRPNDAIHNVFSMIGSQLEVHGIKVHKDLLPNLPTLRINLSRLEQVIMNLVVNARQALDECNHDHKQIWIRSYATSGDLIHIEIEDNATGIPDNMKVKIFDPFFTTKEVGQGTGLGLTISNSIISDLNGSIEVFNNDKGGAIFTVVIPSIGGNR